VFPVEIGLTPLDLPEGPFTLATITDITRRKQYKESDWAFHFNVCSFATLRPGTCDPKTWKRKLGKVAEVYGNRTHLAYLPVNHNWI
jgi:hypothetical protein